MPSQVWGDWGHEPPSAIRATMTLGVHSDSLQLRWEGMWSVRAESSGCPGSQVVRLLLANREPGPWSMNYVALIIHSRDTEEAKVPTAWGTVHVDSTQCRAPGLPTFP